MDGLKVTAWQRLAMSSFMQAILSCGRQPVRSSSDCWPRNGTCVCHKNWRNWTNLPV